MSNPNYTSLIIPVGLQNLSIRYKPENLIGEEIFPIVPVPSLDIKILKYTKASYFRVEKEDMYRAPGTSRKRINYEHATTTANPRQISREIAVPDEFVDLASMPAQLPFNPQIDAVERLKTEVDLFKEILLSNVIFGTTWLDGAAGGADVQGAWGLTTTSNTFIKDIYDAKAAFVASHGYEPNRLMIDYSTYVAQQNNPNVMDKIKYTQRAIATTDLLASLLQLDKVIVGQVPYLGANVNSGDTVDSSITLSKVWNPSGKGNAFLYRYAPPGLRTVAAGFQYRCPYMGSLSLLRGYRDEPISSTVYQLTENVDIAGVALDMGYAFKDCITT